MLGNTVETALDVTAFTVHASTVGILVLDEVVVKNFAMVIGGGVIGWIRHRLSLFLFL